MYYKTTCSSPLGVLTMAADGENLTGLWIEGQKYHGDQLFSTMKEVKDLPVFAAAENWLNRYFQGDKPLIEEIPLAPFGSEFRRQIWKILCSIPYGQVRTYGDIAKEMAEKLDRKTMSAQAVGGAVAHNPISIIIPCHRVVGAKGDLTGYAGGIEKKIKLLDHEINGLKLSCIL